MTRRFGIAMVAACPFPWRRGTPTRVLRMAEAVAKRGHEVHVVTYHHGEEIGPVPFQIHRAPVVGTYRRTAPGPSYQKVLVMDPLLALTLSRVLARHRIDLIHAHHYEGLLVALCAGRWAESPVIYDAHTLLSSELPFYRLGLPVVAKRWIGDCLDRRLPRRAAHVIAVSEEIRQSLIGFGAAADQITMIGNGVEDEHFAIESRSEVGEKRGERLLIYAGTLAAYQGIELLLTSMREVFAARPDVRLLIATQSSFAPYEGLAARLGIRDRIEIVDAEFQNLPLLLARADVALNPRTACPGLPQKLLNYMAAGRPIVSFAGSAKGLRHGERGLVVADGDVGAFARAILRLLDDRVLAHRLGESARAYVCEERSWERVAEQTEDVYRQVVACPDALGAAASGAGRLRAGL